MNLQTILTVLSYMTTSLILLIGLVLVTGWYLPAGIPENYRLTLGIIMTVYAVYRIWMIRARSRGRSEDESDAGNDQ